MLLEEARLMGRWIADLTLPAGSTCLNLGSSTRVFREETQPFIDREVLAPLRAAGSRVVNCDLKEEDGVDEAGDLLDPAFQTRLIGYRPDLAICSNLLEHLSDPVAFARACGRLVRPGGWCLITVPRSFPYHPDPLDTMFRPTPRDIAALLPDWAVANEAEIEAGSYRSELAASGQPAIVLARQVVRALLPVYRPADWYPAAHKLLWLFRPYKVSLVLLRKPADMAAV